MSMLKKAARVGSSTSVAYQLESDGQCYSCCPMTALLLQEALQQEDFIDLGLKPDEILAMYLKQ